MSDCDRAALIADLEALWGDRCTIVRSAAVPDGRGGRHIDYAEDAEELPCNISPAGRGAERIFGERLTAETSFTIRVPGYAELAHGDRITATMTGGERTFEVVAIADRGQAFERICLCTEIL